jgi:hypothetical protein
VFAHPLFVSFARKAVLPVLQTSGDLGDAAVLGARLEQRWAANAYRCPAPVVELVTKTPDTLKKLFWDRLLHFPQSFFGLRIPPQLPSPLKETLETVINDPKFSKSCVEGLGRARGAPGVIVRCAPRVLCFPPLPLGVGEEVVIPYLLISELDRKGIRASDLFSGKPLTITVADLTPYDDDMRSSLMATMSATMASMSATMFSQTTGAFPQQEMRHLREMLKRARPLPETPGDDLPDQPAGVIRRYLLDQVDNARFVGQHLQNVYFPDDVDFFESDFREMRNSLKTDKTPEYRQECLRAIDRLMPRMQRSIDDAYALLRTLFARPDPPAPIYPSGSQFRELRHVAFNRRDDAWYHWAAAAVPFRSFRATRPFLALFDALVDEWHHDILHKCGTPELSALEDYRQEIAEIFTDWEYQDALSKALDLEELFAEIDVTCLDRLPPSDSETETRKLAFAYLNPPNVASVILYLQEFLTGIDEIWTLERFPRLNPWILLHLRELLENIDLARGDAFSRIVASAKP